MTVRAWVGRALFAMAALAALTGAPRAGIAAEGDTLMEYGVDVVTNYVFRGVDLFSSVYDKEREAHGAFLLSPAIQPSVTFYGQSGLSFGIWGSFAATNRDDEAATSFTGLKSLDELDYTLSYAWENKLGSFSAGFVNYSIVPEGGGLSEVFFTWGLPVAESLAPTLSHYVDIDSSATYTALAISGGEAISWGVSAGLGPKKLQDITGNVGYAFGDYSVAFNLAYRPNPEVVGSYDTEGKYTDATGATSDYPPAIMWLTLSYGGAVTE